MPSNSAEYQRAYRERRKATGPAEAAKPQIDVATGEIARPRSDGYDCGCVPGRRCLSHAIAHLPTAAQDALAEGMRAASPEPWNRYISGGR